MNLKQLLPLLTIAVGLAPQLSATDDARSCCSAPEPRAVSAAPLSDRSLYQVESVWTTDFGRPVKLGVLRGRSQVVVMFFASCQYTCPILLHDLKNIEAALPETLRTNVGFTLISFDSERDTPDALNALRSRRELGSNWTLLHGEPEAVRELALLLGMNYRKDARGQFSHSNLITILNAEGEIVQQQNGVNLPPDPCVKKLESLPRR